MLKVAIVTDGPYGERAFETIGEVFDTEFIEIESPNSMFLDEIEIPKEDEEKIKKSDILITYTVHPDITTDLVYKFNKDVAWIIVASWKGDGMKNQLEKFENVSCPYIMCEIEENGNKYFDEFVSKIGKPKVELELEGGKIKDIKTIRTSPCGSTKFVIDFIKEKYCGKEFDINKVPIEAGLRIQHYPCRAGKLRLFSDEECKKQLASMYHKEALEDAYNKEAKNE
ncbi:MAG: DUF166 domain-containing protein [Methanobacteriaceae archaeon]